MNFQMLFAWLMSAIFAEMGPSSIEMIPASRRLLIRALKSATPSGDKTLNRLLTRASSTVSHNLKRLTF